MSHSDPARHGGGGGGAYRFEVDDGAVGHDRVVSLHHVQLALVVACLRQAVDGAALGAGADGHAGDGLVTAHAVHRACPAHAVHRARSAHAVLWLLVTHTHTQVRIPT